MYYDKDKLNWFIYVTQYILKQFIWVYIDQETDCALARRSSTIVPVSVIYCCKRWPYVLDWLRSRLLLIFYLAFYRNQSYACAEPGTDCLAFNLLIKNQNIRWIDGKAKFGALSLACMSNNFDFFIISHEDRINEKHLAEISKRDKCYAEMILLTHFNTTIEIDSRKRKWHGQFLMNIVHFFF